MANEFIVKNGLIAQNNITVTGSINATSGITGSLSGTAATASYIATAQTSSYILNAQSASYILNAQSASLASTASYALTSSYANAFTVGGTLTAQTLVVQTITSSQDFVTGSTKFGSISANTHQFTGSVSMSGSLSVAGASSLNTATVSGSLTVSGSGTIASYNSDVLEITGSLAVSGSSTVTGNHSVSGSMLVIGSTTMRGNQVITGSLTATDTTILASSSGNVGIGITPQGAGSSKTLEIGSRGIIYDNNDNFLYGNNGWVDSGTWKYKQTGYACIIATNSGKFTFSTAASGTQNNAITWNDRFVIENGGNVGIGATPTSKLTIAGNVDSSGGFRSYKGTNATVGEGSNFYLDGSGGYTMWQQTGTNKTSWFQYISGAWGEKMYLDNGSLTTTGNITVGGTLTENSSIRYKTNIENVKYGLDKVLQLRGVTYDKKDTGIKELGLIAEEVNEILPDVVIKNEEGQPDSVSYGRLTAVLIEAVKELQAQINELKVK